MTSPYPPGPPSIGNGALTVDLVLKRPAYLQRAIEDLTAERFITDYIFTPGPAAAGGSVLYDQVTEATLYAERAIQEIEPGSEFPLLTFPEAAPLVATVKKWGGAFDVTDEARDRNRIDVAARNLRLTSNTIIQKMNLVAVAALNAAPVNTQTASGDWSTASTDIVSDLLTAVSTIDQADMGYTADTVLLNPAQALDLRKDADIRSGLPRENVAVNPLLASDLAGLLGLNYIISNRVPAGTVYVLQRQVAGSYSDEQPLSSEVVPMRDKQMTRIQAWRKTVPYVTDPKSVVKITAA